MTTLESLGWGATSTVVRVLDRATDASFALKRPRTDQDSLENEFEVMRAIGFHPNILRALELVDVQCDAPCRGVLLEYCRHGSLYSFRGQLNLLACRRIALQLYRALRHVHAAGFLHRDVKPCNVLLDAEGTVKLGDFGAARPRERCMTTVVTTSWYRCPKLLRCTEEQCEYGEEVDWWAYGCTVLELVNGYGAFEGAKDGTNDEQQRVAQLKCVETTVAKSWSHETLRFARRCLACEDGKELESDDYFDLSV